MNSRCIGGFLAALSCSAVFTHALADGDPGSQSIPVLCGGAVVCRVAPPLLGSGASIEAKEIDGGLAWRIRYEGEGERTIEEETWTFDFDETLFIDGRIGEFAVVARRVGKKWFVGCLNAGERRDFSIPLDFAGNGALKVRLFRDANPDDAKPLAAIAVEELSVSAKESLKVAAAANGGWAAIAEEQLR